MLSKKSSFILTTAAISLLASASYPTLGVAADNSWIKNPQKTAAQEAADKAREERLAEMKASIATRGAKQEPAPAPAMPETKTEEAAKAMPSPKMEADPKASAEPEKQPTVKPRLSWQELAKARRAERLKREQMNAGKAEEKPAEKSATLSHDQNHQSPTINKMIKQGETAEAKPEVKAGIPTPPPPPVRKAPAAVPSAQPAGTDTPQKPGASGSFLDELLKKRQRID